MKGSGFKIGAVIFFLALSGWYLIPSVQGLYYGNKIDNLPEEEKESYQEENYATLRSIQDRALKLGLDLQGGMHVTLEVGLTELLDQLAGERKDAAFSEVLAEANRQSVSEGVPRACRGIFVATKSPGDPPMKRLRPICRDRRMMLSHAPSKSFVIA